MALEAFGNICKNCLLTGIVVVSVISLGILVWTSLL